MKEDTKKINRFYSILKNTYKTDKISTDRQEELSQQIKKYGYLPYPYIKALKELSDEEVLFCLELKLENEGVFKDGQFNYSEQSVLARHGANNSDWIKRECHDIKLINLSGLGDGNNQNEKTRFMNWLRQLIILPTGNLEKDIYNTTIYLTPFHPRAFGCAYIPQGSEVSTNLEDKEISKITGLSANEQVKMFIALAQLAGHPVIYDILPQTGRFSKTVLANPECVRWFNVNTLIKQICNTLDNVWNLSENQILSNELLDKYSRENINSAIKIYEKYLTGERKFAINDEIKQILKDIDRDKILLQFKKQISNKMQIKDSQKLLQQQVKNIVQKMIDSNSDRITENDIKNRDEIELALIKDGLWSLPGGAWNSSGVPAFDKMAKNALYPMMRHYDFKDEDVTNFANLDCQSPFYFVYLENGEYNQEVINFYINYVKQLVLDFNFDGIRIDHVNHVIDELSMKDGKPISYRIPAKVLKDLNDELKQVAPYFASMAEYMLNRDNIKEYHEDMNFDIVYGNDILLQSYKKPTVVDSDNIYVSKYNHTLDKKQYVSVLKTYNNQDGEYTYINQYPGQLGKDGALFKWFMYKFMPGGYYAQRPMMYVDGDESFSKGGIEATICNEVFMKRNDDLEFYEKFDAIDRFAKNNNTICYGEAHILQQDDDGFVYWQIQTNDVNNFLIVVANYNYPQAFVKKDDKFERKIGIEVNNKTIKLHAGYEFCAEYIFKEKDYVEEQFSNNTNVLNFEKLLPSEFKFYKVIKV